MRSVRNVFGLHVGIDLPGTGITRSSPIRSVYSMEFGFTIKKDIRKRNVFGSLLLQVEVTTFVRRGGEGF